MRHSAAKARPERCSVRVWQATNHCTSHLHRAFSSHHPPSIITRLDNSGRKAHAETFCKVGSNICKSTTLPTELRAHVTNLQGQLQGLRYRRGKGRPRRGIIRVCLFFFLPQLCHATVAAVGGEWAAALCTSQGYNDPQKVFHHDDIMPRNRDRRS